MNEKKKIRVMSSRKELFQNLFKFDVLKRVNAKDRETMADYSDLGQTLPFLRAVTRKGLLIKVFLRDGGTLNFDRIRIR